MLRTPSLAAFGYTDRSRMVWGMAGGISDDEPGSQCPKRHVRKNMSISAGQAREAAVEIAPAPTARRAREAGEQPDLPAVVNVRDLAEFLRISEKAVRHRVTRGQLPRPFRCGKALAWTREVVITWLWECGRTPGPTNPPGRAR